MKKIARIVLGVLLMLLFVYTVYFLYENSKPVPVIYQTDRVALRSITSKIIANGTIIPWKEVNIKPHISGIIEEIYVKEGQEIKAGQLIAKIKIIPNMVEVNAAESQLETARINYMQAESEYKRQKPLYNDKVISDREFQEVKKEMKLRKEAYQSAVSHLELKKKGSSGKNGHKTNLIYSTIDGMVLHLPVKSGSSVIESNNFNEGTTIATISNMSLLIFEGKVDETEIGKIKSGMPVRLTIGAFPDKKYNLKLDYIAPKGTIENGTVYFIVRANLNLKADEFIHAGLSANADIILKEKEFVFAVKESILQFENDSVFVEVETDVKQVFEKRYIKTGISDGIYVEVVSGIKSDEIVKIPMEKLEKK